MCLVYCPVLHSHTLMWCHVCRPGVDPLDMEADIQSVLSKGVVGPQRKRSLNDF